MSTCKQNLKIAYWLITRKITSQANVLRSCAVHLKEQDMQITARGAEFTFISLVVNVVYASMETYLFNNTRTLHFRGVLTLIIAYFKLEMLKPLNFSARPGP